MVANLAGMSKQNLRWDQMDGNLILAKFVSRSKRILINARLPPCDNDSKVDFSGVGSGHGHVDEESGYVAACRSMWVKQSGEEVPGADCLPVL